jgi:hypothetical protein
MTFPQRLAVGGHTVDCLRALKSRLGEIFEDIYPNFTGLRAPVETEPGSGAADVRLPRILAGWPDPDDRENRQLPFVLVRAISGEAGGDGRRTMFQIAIASHCPEVDDHEYALVILERIWRKLAERPSLGDGLYLIDSDGITWSELADLMQNWQAYVIGMTVPIYLPKYLQTEDVNGNPLIWENSYPQAGEGAGTGTAPT